MGDIDRNEQMRAVIGNRGLAIEWLNGAAAGTTRKQPAHQIDHESQTEALWAPGRKQHAGNRLGTGWWWRCRRI